MNIQQMREGLGVTQRQLARKTGIPQVKLSRLEKGERDLTPAETILITTALGGKVQQPAIEANQRKGSVIHKSRPGERRAFICPDAKCVPPRRIFLTDEPEGFVPRCPEHGKMIRQPNRPYKGQATA